MDRLDTPPELVTDPHVQAAAALAAELTAAAEAVDVDGTTRARVDRIAHAGFLGLEAPVEYGGADAPSAVVREVTELLAAADGTTWFVATQHRTPLAAVLASRNEVLREHWLRPMATGKTLAGVAFSHLRSAGPPAVTATPVEGGWYVDGTVAWMTSWGLCDVFLLVAQTPDDEHLFALLPAKDGPGLSSTGPLPLAAMAGTATTRLALDSVLVRPDDVVGLEPRERWLARDPQSTANVSPRSFGLLRAVLRQLRAVAARRDEPAPARLADELDAEAVAVRTAAYRLFDEVPADAQLAERQALRAHALELGVRASAALVTAGAGASMSLRNPAQRLAREALFNLIQAQTLDGRTAILGRLSQVGRASR